MQEQLNAKYDLMFDKFDANKDGTISREEMCEFLAQLFGFDISKIDFQKLKYDHEINQSE